MQNNKYIKIIGNIILSFVLLLFAFTFYYIQIINGDDYQKIAQDNFFFINEIKPIRGMIYDRKYKPIAINESSINFYMIPTKIKNKKKVIDIVCENFDIKEEKLEEIIYNSRFSVFQKIMLKQDVKYEDYIKISEKLDEYPSLFFATEPIRKYLFPNHFVGYVRKVDDVEYRKLKDKGYTMNSIIGKAGLEKEYEHLLFGEKGYNVIEEKNLNLFGIPPSQLATDGYDIITTIDVDLQKHILTLLENMEKSINLKDGLLESDSSYFKLKGAVAVMDVAKGGILSYVSFPEYDGNDFVKLTTEKWNKLNNDEAKPLLDRVSMGLYPPGSVFKPVIASLALENNIIFENTLGPFCKGKYKVGNRYFKCWNSHGCGTSNVVDAIKRSCDVFFYDLSLKVKLDDYREFTKGNFLLDKTGIDLPSEREGFFPDEQWYTKTYGEYISIKGLKVNLAIGQGEISLSPLQLLAYYNAIANNGVWVRPHFFDRVINTEKYDYVKEEKKLPISEHTLKILQEALYKAVNEGGGTGGAARFTKDIRVYGKTGSSENHKGDLTHSWFVCYGSWNNIPKISIIVFLENIGHGGSFSAPFAREIIKNYDELRK